MELRLFATAFLLHTLGLPTQRAEGRLSRPASEYVEEVDRSWVEVGERAAVAVTV